MLEWHTKQVNDIETNPLDCYWALGKVFKNDNPRLYTIIEQFPSDENGLVKVNAKPELYILFESLGHCGQHFSTTIENEKDFDEWKYAERFGDYFFKSRGTFVKACRTLEEAKQRAEFQLKAIRDIIDVYFPNDDM